MGNRNPSQIRDATVQNKAFAGSLAWRFLTYPSSIPWLHIRKAKYHNDSKSIPFFIPSSHRSNSFI